MGALEEGSPWGLGPLVPFLPGSGGNSIFVRPTRSGARVAPGRGHRFLGSCLGVGLSGSWGRVLGRALAWALGLAWAKRAAVAWAFAESGCVLRLGVEGNGPAEHP